MDPLTAGAGLLSSGLNYLSTQKTNEMNKDLMQQQMQWQENMMDKQNALQDPVYQASRLRAAGINPALSTTGDTPIRPMDSAGVAGVQPATMVAPQVDLTNAFNSAYNNAKTDADRKLTEENARVVSPLAQATVALNNATTENLQQHTSLLFEQVGLTKIEQEKAVADIQNTLALTRNLDDEHYMNRFRSKILQVDAFHRDAQNLAEIGLKQATINDFVEKRVNYWVDRYNTWRQAQYFQSAANKADQEAEVAKAQAGDINLNLQFLKDNPLALEGKYYGSFLNVSQLWSGADGKPRFIQWGIHNPLQQATKHYLEAQSKYTLDKNGREDVQLKWTITKDCIRFVFDRYDKSVDRLIQLGGKAGPMMLLGR